MGRSWGEASLACRYRLDWGEWGSLDVRGTPPQCPRASIIGKPGERPPAPWSNNGLVPRTAHVGSDPVHQDTTQTTQTTPSELNLSCPPSESFRSCDVRHDWLCEVR